MKRVTQASSGCKLNNDPCSSLQLPSFSNFSLKGIYYFSKKVVKKRERKKNITISLDLEKGMRLKQKGKIPVLTVIGFNKKVSDDFFFFLSTLLVFFKFYTKNKYF